jgi:ABC-type branched-subunit amino acid transport system substrate-binding protein
MRRSRGWWSFAVLVVAISSAAACTTSSSSSSSSKPSGSGATTPGARTASATGVTADAIKIGFTYPDLAALAATGLIKADDGPYDKMMQALVDDVNTNGGVDGRKLVLAAQGFSVTDPVKSLATCSKMTEDDKVFAVLGVFSDSAAALCVVQQHATTLVGGYGLPYDDALLAKARAPWANWYAKTERSVPALVQALDKNGLLEGKTIALYGYGATGPALINIAKQALQTAGKSVAATSVINVPLTDTQAYNAQEKIIGQQFKDAHVDAVFVLGGAPPGTNFDAIGFYPEMFLPSVENVGAAAYTNPLAKFPRIVATSPSGDPNAAFDTPAMQHCRQVWKQRTGQEIVNGAKTGSTTDMTWVGMEYACSALQIFIAAAKAAGPSLTNVTWLHGLESIGKIAIPNAPIASFGPNKADANDNFQLEQFNRAWTPGSPVAEFIPIGQPVTTS